jgi:manganese/zinc/iron transport system substrate-binding protein
MSTSQGCGPVPSSSNRRLLRSLLVAGSLALLLAAGCGPSQTKSDQQPAVAATYRGAYPIRIVTTVGMVTDIVREVAGEHATVDGLLGEGVDPHLYKPTRSDVQRLSEADIVFYSGLNLEGRMTEALHQAAGPDRPVFAVTECLDADYLRSPAEFEGHHDPHVWMDVAAWSRCTGFVAETLAKFDPQHADDYRRRSEAYRKQLGDLDEYVRKVVDSIPEPQRVLVTAHDAFGYFSRGYKIPVQSAQGVSTESEAGVEDVNRLVDFLVERKLKAIFIESSVNPRNLEAVVAGVKRRDHEIAIGGLLYSDAMGPSGTYEGTYIGMLDHNATTIARALGGDAPEGGLNGKLGGK